MLSALKFYALAFSSLPIVFEGKGELSAQRQNYFPVKAVGNL